MCKINYAAFVFPPYGAENADEDEYNFQSDNELSLLRIGFNN